MDDTKKMLRAVINGQSAMKSELLARIDSVDQKFTSKIDGLDKKNDGVEERLTERIDMIGFQVANLEDDTPTRGEHDELEKRVTKLEHRVASV
jgi:hypothetical protein